MTAHEIHGLSGAYAVDALDPEERARFEAHLAVCAECRAEVASLQEATSLLGDLSATVPPPALRDRVLADISNVRPLPPPVVELAGRRRPRWVNAVAAAAAAAAFFGGGAVAWQATHDDTSDVANPADSVIQAADAQHVTVDLGGGTSATVYRSQSLNRAAIVTRNMDPAPDGRVYQLWFQKGDRMVPAGVMHGDEHRALLLDGDVTGASGAGITVEPEGGSTEPTTAPVALFDFKLAT